MQVDQLNPEEIKCPKGKKIFTELTLVESRLYHESAFTVFKHGCKMRKFKRIHIHTSSIELNSP